MGTGNLIRFNKAAKYYAFGFRGLGDEKVTGVTVACDGKALSVVKTGLSLLLNTANECMCHSLV